MKFGWVFLAMIVLVLGSVSCKTEVKSIPTPETPILAPSPMETMDGSLKGDGWYYGQTPQSYNTGKNQVPMSAEETQRIKEELEKEMRESGQP